MLSLLTQASGVGGALKAIKGTPQVNLGLPMEEEDISFEQARLLALELDGNENDPDSPAKDQDSDALGGVWVPFKRKFTGCEAHVSDVKMKGILKKTSDLNRIEKGPIRGEIYRYWEKKLNIIALRELRAHLTEYHKMVRDYQVTKVSKPLHVARHSLTYSGHLQHQNCQLSWYQSYRMHHHWISQVSRINFCTSAQSFVGRRSS